MARTKLRRRGTVVVIKRGSRSITIRQEGSRWCEASERLVGPRRRSKKNKGCWVKLTTAIRAANTALRWYEDNIPRGGG
jgi:hypothetical protein